MPSDPICLTEDEAAALREILAMLATIGERGFIDDRQMVEITAQTWHHELVRPAQRLRRITQQRRLPSHAG